MKDKTNLTKYGLCELINVYLRDEIDAEVFANLVILNHFCTGDIFNDIGGTVLFVMDSMVSKKPFTPHDRKKVKEQLKKLIETYNQFDKTEKDKKEKIEQIILNILEICKGDPNDE